MGSFTSATVRYGSVGVFASRAQKLFRDRHQRPLMRWFSSAFPRNPSAITMVGSRSKLMFDVTRWFEKLNRIPFSFVTFGFDYCPLPIFQSNTYQRLFKFSFILQPNLLPPVIEGEQPSDCACKRYFRIQETQKEFRFIEYVRWIEREARSTGWFTEIAEFQIALNLK